MSKVLVFVLGALAVPSHILGSSANVAGVEFAPSELRAIFRASPLNAEAVRDPTNRYSGDPAAIAFGRKLFFDTRLSEGERYACATCHQPEHGWGDGAPIANPKSPLPRHTPSLWNVGYNRWFNWDGGADSLWAQALGPIESSHEMASDRIRIVRLIIQDMELRSAYRQVFGQIHEILSLDSLPEFGRPNSGDKGSPEHNAWMRLENDEQHAVNSLFTNVAKAIAAFQETIISTQAPFDRFVEGLRTGAEEKLQAISLSAKRGMKLFFGKAKCSVCHAGPTLSDLEFHNTFLPQRDQWSKNDFGRYDGITKAKTAEFNSSSVYNDAAPSKYVDWTRYLTRTIEQRGQFKTPSLRNVARTAPYTHTGQFATLSEATGHCSDMDDAAGEDEHSEVIVSSLDLTASEKQDIVEFLMTLTDESFLARLDGNGHH